MYGLWVVSSLKWSEGSLSCQHKIAQSRWRWLSTWQEVQIHHWSTKFKTLTIKLLWNNCQHNLERTSKIFWACVRTHRLSIFARKCLNLTQSRELQFSRPSNILTWLNSIKRMMNHWESLLVTLTLISNFSVWRLGNSSSSSTKKPNYTTMLQHSKLTLRIFKGSHKVFWTRDSEKIVSAPCTSRTHKWSLVQRLNE